MNKLLIGFVLMVFVTGSMARTFAVLSQDEEPVVVLMPLDDENNDDQQLIRQKRQFGFGRGRQFGGNFGPQQFGQSSAQAQANAFNHQFGPNGFGASNSLAGAQSFNSQGPLGGFGASAANSGSQGINCGFNGCSGNAGMSGSQSYNFGDRKVAIAYGNGFNFVPGQRPSITNSNSISYT